MPGLLAHVGMVALCPHGGAVMEIPSAPRVLVSGMPIATMGDQYAVVACTFPPSGPPHPCVRVQWLVPAVRVQASLLPVIVQTSVGMCLAADQAPQGPPLVSSTQPRVIGT
jgi:hypothetical protein